MEIGLSQLKMVVESMDDNILLVIEFVNEEDKTNDE